MIKFNNQQRGVSLVITFLILTIMLAVVLGIAVILFSKIKIVSNIGASISSFYAAETGVEKTLYFDRKQIPPDGNRGLCNICSGCNSGDCQNCTATPLSAGGCDPLNCRDCRVNYSSAFDGKSYSIDAKVTPYVPTPGVFIFSIDSKGLYKNTTRVLEVTSTQ